MATVPVLHISAFTHHQWYMPGDTVRVQAYLECVRTADTTKKNTFVAQSAPPLHNYFSVDDTFASSEGDSEIHVLSLHAAISGHCRTNFSVVDYDWGVIPLEVPQVPPHKVLSKASADGDQDTHALFGSKWCEVAENVSLRARQCSAFAFSFRLPSDLPPTYTLQEVDTAVVVNLAAAWQHRKVKTDGDARPRVTDMMLPVRVFSAAAAISHVSYSAAFPLAADDPLVKSNYEFAATALPVVPSCAVSGPLEDSLYPSQSQTKGLATTFRDALESRQNQLADMCEPVSVTVPVGTDAAALEVRLLSSFVSVGGCVRGVLIGSGIRSRSGLGASAEAPEDDDTPVLVRASGTLEMLECCPAPVTAATVPFHAVRGVDNVALLHKYPISVQEWVLLDSPTTPFCFTLNQQVTHPTTLTDIGIVLWQLRVKVHWTTQGSLAKSKGKGAETLSMCTSCPELVIPLTVVPPRVPERPRRGQVYSTFFSS